MSRAEERAKKRALKQEKFEASKAKLIERVASEALPKAALEPKEERATKLAPHLERELAKQDAERLPKFGGSRFSSFVTWCITKKDVDGEWGWGDKRAWTQEEWEKTVVPAFNDFECLTWAEIDALGSDTGHKMHHSQELDELHEEAQARWLQLGYEEFADSIFRFRVGNKKRAWGYVVQAHFHMVWYERQHKIYVSK